VVVLLVVAFYGHPEAHTTSRPYNINRAKPYSVNTSLANRRAKVRGWFRPGGIFIARRSPKGEPGFVVIKPFGFVRQPNPSLGWPSWFALDAILARVGWVPKQAMESWRSFSAIEPLFEAPTTIRGMLKLTTPRVVKLRGQLKAALLKGKYPPAGLRILPIYLVLDRVPRLRSLQGKGPGQNKIAN
jgi:hypothetical protein